MARSVLLALLLAAPALAGCLGSDAPAADADADAAPRVVQYPRDCRIANWLEACAALASPNDSPSKTEVDVAVNPLDPLNVFVASKDLDPVASDCVWSVGQVTKDGGESWTTVYVGGTRDERGPDHPLAGYQCVTDPIMAFDADGVLYYALQAYEARPRDAPTDPFGVATAGSAFFLAVSRDGGESFPAEDIVPLAVGDGTVAFHDYPRMVVSPASGSVSVIWNVVGPAGVNAYVTTTRDGGASAGAPVVLAMPEHPRSTVFASGYAAASDGTLYATVYGYDPASGLPPSSLLGTGGAGDGSVTPRLAVSTDDARTFGGFLEMPKAWPIPRQLPGGEYRTGSAWELAVDTSGGERDGRIYVTWSDYRFNSSDVLAAWSDDGGASWSEPVRVTDDANDQFMQRTHVDASGVLHVVHMDRRFDPANRLLDVTHSWSEDGGATWRYQRLTERSFDGDLGVHQDGFPFIGDYVGIGGAGDDVWFGYPTTVSGRAEVVVARATRAEG